DNARAAATPVEVAPWPLVDLLQSEKKSLGFYLSGHPYSAYQKELADLVSVKLGQLSPQYPQVVLAGIVHATRTLHGKRGRMAFVTLDDGSARVEVAVFQELFEANRAWLKEDQLLVVEGKVSRDDYTGGFKVGATRLYDLDAARAQFAKSMCLCLNGEANARLLMEILTPYRPGNCAVEIAFRNARANCTLKLGEQWRVRLQGSLIQSLTAWLNEENIAVHYRP
ncbi:MAG: OB-fold nucleic acid binding domain-containing protein, partial [Burkholderiales bacterium]